MMSPIKRVQIGTVTTLRDRAYAVNPDDDINDPNTVVGLFPAGEYPVFREGDVIYWEIENAIPSLWVFELRSLGDGMFTSESPGHRPTGDPPVKVRSKRFTLAEFEEFRTTDFSCLPGPEQRLSFDVQVMP